MTKITILAVGKIKEKFYQMAIAEYSKRLGRYCKLEIIEVADEKIPQDPSPKVMEQIKEKEGQRLLKYLREDAYIIALAIEGKMLSSKELAGKMENLAVGGVSHLQFIIGGSLGLSEEVLLKADFSLSFSKMTFPHPLMRVILLEQIYRSYRILTGSPYDK